MDHSVKQFKKILVGVDLSDGDRIVGDELSPPSAEAVERALWLAKLNSARLQFFFALDVGYQAQRFIQENKDTERTVLDKAEEELSKLVARATKLGLSADFAVTFGKSWLEIIHQVLREKNDLVIVGAKQWSAVERLFIGSTGMKLLRKCPCPVWVVHPPSVESEGAVLVGHDLTEVGDLALGLGASMAEARQTQLHVVHVIENLHINAAEPLAVATTADESTHQAARERILQQLKPFQLGRPAEVHIVNGSSATVLLEHAERHHIGLVVMGTIARGGIDGLLFGNTAERLLPQIGCSVLAVKPENFQSPIRLE